VVLGELISGAYHSGPAYRSNNLTQIATLRQQFASLPFDDPAAEQYGRVREQLASAGMPIGPNDLLIASIALANGLTLVTHNTTEFSRVPGLAIEDWQ
jgi:tRNA(fMet)-specific endonuclease VapC